MFVVLITVQAVLVGALVAWYVAILVINGRKIPEELDLTPLLSTRCHVKSDAITGFASGKEYNSAVPARLSVYGNFIVLKSIAGRVYHRERVTFTTKPGLLRERLFIRLKSVDTAVEIVGNTAKIIPALKMAGYTSLEER